MNDKTKNEIIGFYQRGQGSIQDLARIYGVSVDEVLQLIGAGDLGAVTVGGDLIDASEAGAGAQMNYGKDYKVPFTLN